MVLLLWFLRIHAWTWTRRKTRHLPDILLCIQNGSKTVSSSKFACKLAWIRGVADVYDGGGLLVMVSCDTFLNASKMWGNLWNCSIVFIIPHKKCKRFLGKIFLLFQNSHIPTKLPEPVKTSEAVAKKSQTKARCLNSNAFECFCRKIHY